MKMLRLALHTCQIRAAIVNLTLKQWHFACSEDDTNAPSCCRWFMQWLEESATDFRVGSEFLQQTRFAVFGCGSSVYGEDFNKVRLEEASP